MGLAELDGRFHDEDRFARSILGVDVDRTMLVAVEEESVAVLFEDLWHGRRLRLRAWKDDSKTA